VGLESQHAADQGALARFAHEALEHRLVAAMNAVEITDRQRDRRKLRIGSAMGKQHELEEQT